MGSRLGAKLATSCKRESCQTCNMLRAESDMFCGQGTCRLGSSMIASWGLSLPHLAGSILTVFYAAGWEYRGIMSCRYGR